MVYMFLILILFLSGCSQNKNVSDRNESIEKSTDTSSPDNDSTWPFRILDGEIDHNITPEEMQHHASKGINTLEDAYMAGYDNGHEVGKEDGSNGSEYGKSFDSKNDFSGRFLQSYEDGYAHGYHDGYHIEE